MAQEGRAVIAAILVSILLGFPRLASADSACLHCEVSPFRQYFRSTEGEHQGPVNTIHKDRTNDADPVKSCRNMCIALAQDGPTGKLLEKYLPKSVSKLSSWLKSVVEDSFTVDNKTNSIRRKRDARYDVTPEDYDFVEEYVEEDFPDWDDSVAQMKALPQRFKRRHRHYGKQDKPKPKSDCLARQQELLMEVMTVFDEIAEQAIEELQRMLQEEFEREMLELEPFKVPMWWIVGLQQNNLILPYAYNENTQPEVPQEIYTPQQPSPFPEELRSSPTHDPEVSTSRASAVAIAMGDSAFTSVNPYDTMPPQSWYPYQNNPWNQQTWYSPDGSAQVVMGGSPGQPVYVAAYASKPEETTGNVPKPMGFPDTTPVSMTDGLPDTKPMVQQPGVPQTSPTVGNTQETTPVPETGSPQTTPQINGGMPNMTQSTAGNTEVPQTTTVMPQTTPKVLTGMSHTAKPEAGNTDAPSVPQSGTQQPTPKTEAGNASETEPVTESTGLTQTTPKGGNGQETTTPVPTTTTGSPQTTPKGGNIQETTPVSTTTTGSSQTTGNVGNATETTPVSTTTTTTVSPQTTGGNTQETTPLSTTTGSPQTTANVGNATETTPVPTTTTGSPQTTPKVGNATETTPVPSTTTTASPQTTANVGNATETTPVPTTTTGSPQTTPKMYGGFNKPKPGQEISTTPKADAAKEPETAPTHTTPTPAKGRTQESTPVPQTGLPKTTPKADAENRPESEPAETPEVELPEIELPEAPEVELPEIELPETPEGELPEVEPGETPEGDTQETARLPQTTPEADVVEIELAETTPIPMTTLPPQTTPKMFGGTSPNNQTNLQDITITQETTPETIELSPQLDNTAPDVTSTQFETTPYPYTTKPSDMTVTLTIDIDALGETTRPADETDSDISTRALLRFNDEVTQPDCNSAPTNRFLPAILKVLKLKSQK